MATFTKTNTYTVADARAGIVNPNDFPTEQVAVMLLLRSALVENKQIAFEYEGQLRIVEVHALGTSTKDGGLVVRGYQVAGESSSSDGDRVWRLFRLDKFDTYPRVLSSPSKAPREGYAQEDRQMSVVLSQIILDDNGR